MGWFVRLVQVKASTLLLLYDSNRTLEKSERGSFWGGVESLPVASRGLRLGTRVGVRVEQRLGAKR